VGLNFNEIEDYKFNPFTKTKYYTTITDESQIVPASPIYDGYLIWLYHAPRETVPTSISITIGGNPLLEVSSAPGNMQYRVFYDEDGCGCIEFNGNQAGLTALITYQHYGTFNSRAFAQAIYDAFYSGNSQISGLSMLNSPGDLDHDIDFGAGSVHNITEKLRVMLSAMTKKLDAVFTAGTNQGMLDTGTIGANADYYLYLIGKNTDPAAGDILASLNATTPALPATWTNYTLIGICQTDAASKIRLGKWSRNLNEIEFRYKVYINDFPMGATGSTARLLKTLTVPLGTTAKFYYLSNQGLAWMTYGETFETDTAPTNFATSKIYGDWIGFEGNLKVDSNKQIYFRCSVVNMDFDIKTLGWKITL
jgi:hypothetical protein